MSTESAFATLRWCYIIGDDSGIRVYRPRQVPEMVNRLSLDALRARFGGEKRREETLLDEIGAAASSAPRFDQAFETLANAIRAVVPFDRMSIRFADLEDGTFTEAYFTGVEIPGHDAGAEVPLEGTITEAAARDRKPIRVGEDLPEVLASRFPGAQAAIESGLRSVLMVPMAPRGQIVPTLMLASKEPAAYTDHHLDLAALAARKIAGPLANAIANAQVQLSLQQQLDERERQVSDLQEGASSIQGELEELHERTALAVTDSALAQALAGVALAAGATIDGDDAYVELAQKMKALVAFDQLEIAVVDAGLGTAGIAVVNDAGYTAPHADGVAIGGTHLEQLVRDRAGIIGGAELASAAGEAKESEAASAMSVPLVAGGAVLGALTFLSSEAGAYTDEDLALGAQIGDQVSGAFAASEALERLTRESEERTTLADIGRLAGSSGDLTSGLDSAVETIQRLVQFDLSLVESVDEAPTVLWVWGEAGPAIGSASQMEEGSRGNMQSGNGLVAAFESPEELQARFPDRSFITTGGFRSLLVVPVIAGESLAGVLYLCSTAPIAYDGGDLALAERIGSQIALAVALSHRIEGMRRQADGATKESAVFAEMGKALASRPNVQEAYSAVLDLLRGMVSFDRVGVATVDGEDGTLMYRYVEGTEEAGFRPNAPQQLDGTTVQEAVSAGAGFIVQKAAPEAITSRFPALVTGVNSGLRSFVEAPIFVGGQIAGSIGIGSASRVYSDTDLAAVERVGSLLSLPIEMARLDDAHKQDTREQVVFAEMGRTLASTLDIRMVYDRIADYMRRLVPYDRMALWTVDLAGENLIGSYSAGDGDGPTEEAGSLPLGSGASENGDKDAASQGDASSLPQRLAEFLRSSAVGMPSLLVIPLEFAGETVGMISLRSSMPSAYTRKDAAIAERFAAHLAGAVSNSQLYIESKQVEDAVRDVVERLDLAVLGSGDGLWDWKIPSSEVWWSQRYKELIGYTPGLGNGGMGGWASRLHPEDRARVLEALKAHIESKGPYRVEYRLSTSSGDYRWFSDRGQAIWDESGEAVRMAGSLRPITEATARATASAAAPGGTHDIIAPYLALEVFRSALLTARPEASDLNESGYVEAIVSAGRPLRLLLDGLDTLRSAMDAEVSAATVDLTSMARSIISDLRRRESGSRTTSVARGLKVEGDQALLRLLMEKLLENAWRFTGTREKGRIVVGAEERDGETAFFVRDNGVGFHMTDAENLFGLFQRLHSPTDFDGVGLGLVTARLLVTRQGGRIWAEAEPGKGATFFFTI